VSHEQINNGPAVLETAAPRNTELARYTACIIGPRLLNHIAHVARTAQGVEYWSGAPERLPGEPNDPAPLRQRRLALAVALNAGTESYESWVGLRRQLREADLALAHAQSGLYRSSEAGAEETTFPTELPVRRHEIPVAAGAAVFAGLRERDNDNPSTRQTAEILTHAENVLSGPVSDVPTEVLERTLAALRRL